MQETTQRQGAAWNPITHFIVAPVLLVSLGASVYLALFHRHEHPLLYPWLILFCVALFLLNVQSRLYALRVQDRLIRLEERIRLERLLSPIEWTRVQMLTTKQLIGLRFAADAELPSLALRAVNENLTQAQIKQDIQVWRPDLDRV